MKRHVRAGRGVPALAAVMAGLWLGACATIEPPTGVVPLIPLQSRFAHWDHHWFFWTPTHPVYESIEVAAKPIAPGRDLVRAWFTERAGGKRQVHYLNDERIARAWGRDAADRDIVYRTTGEPGSPLDLHVRFRDRDDAGVEWAVRVDHRRGFDTAGAGLTDQSGHGAARFFLVFFREKSVRTTDSRLTVGGREFSFPDDAAIVARHRFQASYSSNVFTVTLPYARGDVLIRPDRVTLPLGYSLRLLEPPGAIVYRGEVFGPGNVVTATLDRLGQLRSYEHASGGHRFRVSFDPPLPTATGGRSRYRLALDDWDGLVEGVATVTKHADGVSVEWRHEKPEWTVAYPMTSTLTAITRTGYRLTVAPARR